jgi:hypothetical protein
MSDNGDGFTEYETEGWGSRIGNSFIGALIGIVLIVASVVLLYWNEGRAVDASRALNQAASQVVEVNATALDPQANNKLVHMSGMMETSSPARDPLLGIGGPGLLRLKRQVEMYQWKQEEKTETQKNLGGSETKKTTYTYRKEWSSETIDSSRFRETQNHRNPPMPINSTTIDSPDVKLGVYRVDPALLDNVSAFKPFAPGATPAGYQNLGDVVYRAQNPSDPAIGDIRVTYSAVPAQTMSVIALQASGILAPYPGVNGYQVGLAEPGLVTADVMVKEKKHEEQSLTWILRGVGFAVMLIGFFLAGGPLATLVAFLPFLEDIVDVGVFLIAFMMAVPLTLFVIALAWFAHRPLLSGGLIVAGIAAAIGLRMLRRGRPRQPASATG